MANSIGNRGVGNGPLSTPTDCNPLSWQNGNLNGNQAHYFEGDSVPYRLSFLNLATTGTHSPMAVTAACDHASHREGTTQAAAPAIQDAGSSCQPGKLTRSPSPCSRTILLTRARSST